MWLLVCGFTRSEKLMSEQHENKKFNWQDFKMHANNKLLWWWRTALSRERNPNAALFNMWCECTLCYTQYLDGGARTAFDRLSTVAQYYNFPTKADCGDIWIIHNLKSWYRTLLPTSVCAQFRTEQLKKLFFNILNVPSLLSWMHPCWIINIVRFEGWCTWYVYS